MIRALIASFRLAFAFVCVGIGLILGAQWFGLIPDTRVQEMAARHKFCETIAIGLLDAIESENVDSLTLTFEVLVKNNPELLSVGFRSESGLLRSATSEHTRSWNVTAPIEVESDVPEWARPQETVQAMPTNAVCTAIPIMVDQRSMGELEFCFRAPPHAWTGGLIDHGLVRLLMFFAGVGMCSYTLLMMRIMGGFSRTAGVPDGVRHALDTLAEGLLLLDDTGRIVLANQTFASINGYEPDELTDRNASDLPWTFAIGEVAAAPRIFPWIQAIQQRQTITGYVLRLTGRDGTLRVFSVNAASIGTEKENRGALVTFQDVTHVEKHRVELENMLSVLKLSKEEIQNKNRELEVLATRDALTGCLNRRAFFERMAEIFETHQREGIPLSCFMVDVDHFKKVNDTYGHHIGDEVLRKVSKLLRDLHEENQIVCRYGGEEFCVMLPGSDLDEALIQAECTRLAIAEIRLTEPASLRLTASLGVSELRFNAIDVQELINQADACLYVAKRGGRNQSVPYDPEKIEAMGAEVVASAEKIADPDITRLPFHAVTALVSALAHRDPRSAEHSRRVANLCVRVSEGLMCQHESYMLEVAALLHDIGKIGVPDEILNKRDPLTAEEWKVMRRHNSMGLDMVRGTFRCERLEAIIRVHQELQTNISNGATNTDWSSVPLPNKLLRIADAYDSVTSDHVYRKGSSHEEAARELRRCAGTQFDPELVEHFLTHITAPRTDNGLGVPTTSGIAFAIGKSTALLIGQHIERLCEIMDSEDLVGLASLAKELGAVAEEGFLMPIVDAATKIQESTEHHEAVQWAEVLGDVKQLLDLCRATQNAHLVQS